VEGGKGIVRNVRYENIRMDDIRRAIALNQVCLHLHMVLYTNVFYSTSRNTVLLALCFFQFIL